jgi:hypothetical protein
VAALFREAEYHADHIRRGIADHPYPDQDDKGRRATEQRPQARRTPTRKQPQ